MLCTYMVLVHTDDRLERNGLHNQALYLVGCVACELYQGSAPLPQAGIQQRRELTIDD